MIALALLVAASAGPCPDAGSQAALNACIKARFLAADEAMTTQWVTTKTAMARRDATAPVRGFRYATALLDSQRAWLRFRDAQCVIEGAEYAGGSMQPFAVGSCRTRLTEDRTRQLRALIWRR